MSDVREQIIVRCLEIADSIEQVNFVDRNVQTFDDDPAQFPAIVILDGDEQAIDDEPQRRPPTVPRRFEMSPLFHIAVSAKRDEIGSDLNTLRRRVIRAVLTDATLATLYDRNGVRYDGLETPRTESGRMVLSQRILRFGITYILDTADLAE